MSVGDMVIVAVAASWVLSPVLAIWMGKSIKWARDGHYEQED